MNIEDISPGMQLTWHHESRGGYGFIYKIPVRVVSVSKKMVRIEAPLRRGGSKLTSVRPENLQRRPQQ